MRELDFITLIICSQDAAYKHPQKDSTQNLEALKQPSAKPILRCLSSLRRGTRLLLLSSTLWPTCTPWCPFIARHSTPAMFNMDTACWSYPQLTYNHLASWSVPWPNSMLSQQSFTWTRIASPYILVKIWWHHQPSKLLFLLFLTVTWPSQVHTMQHAPCSMQTELHRSNACAHQQPSSPHQRHACARCGTFNDALLALTLE
jgi:hypothetical protein